MASTEHPAGIAFNDAGPNNDLASIAAAAVMGLDFAAYHDPDVQAHRHGQIQEAVEKALHAAGLHARGFPLALTPDLVEVLGMPNFKTVPMAHAFRDAGAAEIPRRFENEQAFILHWLTGLVLQHGARWRPPASETLDAAIAEAKARKEKGVDASGVLDG